jgi:NADH-quinone oxidoreductase subunit H
MKLEFIFYLLVFPGLLFTAVLGLLAGWVDRKLTARLTYRVGPPIFQNFNDFFKLMGKETLIIKESVNSLFIAAPFLAFSVLVLASSLIGVALFYGTGFLGDILVLMYLLMMFSVLVVLGASSTGNVYSSVGAGREVKLLLADELAFILVCLIPVVKSGYQLNLESIISLQLLEGAFLSSISGFIGFIIGILCVQAKMTLPPFHIPEAETELVEGPYIEYSGPPLAFWKLNHFMMYVVFPFLLIVLFWGGFESSVFGIVWLILKYLLIVIILILIKNTNPRIRIDTALKFFWKYASPAAFAAVVLAIFGL